MVAATRGGADVDRLRASGYGVRSTSPAVDNTSTNRLQSSAAAAVDEGPGPVAGMTTSTAVRTSLPVINEGAVVTLRHYIDLAASSFTPKWEQLSGSEANSSCSGRSASPPVVLLTSRHQQPQQQLNSSHGHSSVTTTTTTLAHLPAQLLMRQEDAAATPRRGSGNSLTQPMPAIAALPSSASSSSFHRPSFSRSGSIPEPSTSLPSIETPRRESNGSSTAGAAGCVCSGCGSCNYGDGPPIKTFEKPRLISVDGQPWFGQRRRIASLTSSTHPEQQLMSTGTDWSVFGEPADDGNPDENALADERNGVDVDVAVPAGTQTTSTNSVTKTVNSRKTNIRKMSRGSDAVFNSTATTGGLTNSSRTVSFTNLSKMCVDDAGRGADDALTSWRRGGKALGATWSTAQYSNQLQRHRSEANVNRVGLSTQRSSVTQHTPNTAVRPKLTSTTTTTTPRKNVVEDRSRQLPPPPDTSRRQGGMIKSTSQPILRRETTVMNGQRWSGQLQQQRMRQPTKTNHLHPNAAVGDDDDADDEDEPNETERRQRIVEWLDAVDPNAERPPTPVIHDEPIQTDTAIHIVYNGD